MRRDIDRLRWSPVVGALWYLAHLPLIWSYALLSHQTLASAPPVRRWLSRLPGPWGCITLNGILAVFVAIFTAAISIPAAQLARIYVDTYRLQMDCMAIIDQARQAGNPLLMMNLQTDLLELGEYRQTCAPVYR